MQMVNQLVPLFIGTGFYGAVFLIAPCFIKKGPNKGIIRCSIYLAVFSTWIFWATVYIAQMHPLIGPRHKNTTLIWMNRDDPQPKGAGNPDVGPPPAQIAREPGNKALRMRPPYCINGPDNLFECCNSPWLPKAAMAKCLPDSVNVLKLTCEEARCAFQQAGWLVMPGIVKTTSVAAYYQQLARDNQEWDLAVHLIKTDCLETRAKYQGTYMSCPEYDIMYCAMIRMFKNGPLATWSTAAACVPAKHFSSNCPICPENCNMRNFKDPSSIMCQACLTF